MDKKSEFITLIVVLISIFIKIMGDLDIGSTDTINYRPPISTTFAKVILTEPTLILSPIQKIVHVRARDISYMEMVIKQNAHVGQVVTVQHPQRRKRKDVFLAALL